MNTVIEYVGTFLIVVIVFFIVKKLTNPKKSDLSSLGKYIGGLFLFIMVFNSTIRDVVTSGNIFAMISGASIICYFLIKIGMVFHFMLKKKKTSQK